MLRKYSIGGLGNSLLLYEKQPIPGSNSGVKYKVVSKYDFYWRNKLPVLKQILSVPGAGQAS